MFKADKAPVIRVAVLGLLFMLQIIWFMMIATSAITSMIAVYLAYKHFYSSYGQLQIPS